MTAGSSSDLLASFRTRVAAHPLLAGLREDFLAAVVAASPSSDADELRTIARDFAPLDPGQVLPLWSAWRLSQREVQADSVAAPAPAPEAARVGSETALPEELAADPDPGRAVEPRSEPDVETEDDGPPPPDAEAVRGRAGGRDIRLSWQRPAGAAGVRVYRNRAHPVPTDYFVHLRRPLDPTASAWVDTDVEPGVTYHYRVTTVDAAGRESSGVDLTVAAPARPAPLVDLDLETVQRGRALTVDLSWPVPVDGAEVWVFASPTAPQRPVPHEQVTVDRLPDLDLGERARGEASLAAGRAVLADVAVPTDGSRVWFTAVSVIGEIAVVGLTVAAIAVAAPTDVEVVDRVSWQLVRFEWPAGATYVDVAPAYPGAPGADDAPVWASRLRINRDRYDRDGGALFDVRHPLDVVPHEIALRGVDRYAGREQHGPTRRVAYPGRWLVDYQLAHPSRHSSARLYTVEIRSLHPQAHWVSPGVTVRVLHHPFRMPLSPTGTDVVSLPIHRDADHGVAAVELPTGSLLAGVPTAVGQVELPDGFVRVIVDSLDPQTPVTLLDPPPPVLLPPSRRLGVRLAPHQFRCRRCLAIADRLPQVFECEFRDCPGRAPQGPQRFTPNPPPPVPGAPFPPAPTLVAGSDCPACRRRSTREICRQCLSAVPPAWFATEPFPVVMAGAKATGKSVYAHVAMTQLQDRVARDLPGHVTEFDAETARRLHDLRELFRGRMLPVSTQGEDGYRPLTFTVSSNHDEPRQRTLAVHDLSGDWIQDRGAVDRYRDQLARAAGIVFLVDVLQVPDVVDYLQGDVAAFATDSLHDPVRALTNVIAAIRGRVGLPPGVPIQVPIAVVISKLDALHLLTRSTRGGGDAPEAATSVRRGMALTRDPYGGGASSPLYDPADAWWAHQETRSLLTSLRAGALVDIVERNFAAFRYFGVSALGHSPAPGQRGVSSFAPFRVDEPFRWLLAEQW